MSERLLTAARWAMAALFLSVPFAMLTIDGPSGSELLEVGLFLSPWALAALGVSFRVPAARGFALGVSALSVTAFLLANGLEMPDGWRDSLLLSQGFGLLLALPLFGPVFEDDVRLRWTAGAVGFAIPAAVIFAVFAGGTASALAYGAIALIALGVIGLAFQRTWSLFALFGGALAIGLTPLALELDPYLSATFAPAFLGWIAAIALVSAWIPWVAPVFRKLRG